MGFGPVSPGKAVEHLDHPHREQWVGLETLLAAEQVQLNQQLIHHAAIQGTDDVRERAMEGALAVSNGESGAHAGVSKVPRP